MKRRFFILLLTLCLSLFLLPLSPQAEDQNVQAFVRTRPIPRALKDVAEAYGENEDWQEVIIRISLPEILLQSADASAANQEIEAMEKALIEDYQQNYEFWQGNMQEGEENPFYYIAICHYEANIYAGVLSVRIISSNGLESNLGTSWIANFDLQSGKRLSDKELVKTLSHLPDDQVDMNLLFEENIIREARNMGDAVENHMRSFSYDSDNDDSKPDYLGVADQSVAETLEMVRRDAMQGAASNREKSVLFLSDNARLNIVYRQQTPAGAGFFYNEAPFYLFSFPRERELNPLYVRMLRDAGRDPWNSPYQGLLACLGPATDRPSLHELLCKVSAFSRKWNKYYSPSPVLSYDCGENTNWTPVATYSEFYLVIPKYANDYIEICELELDSQSQIVEKKEEDRSGIQSGRAFGVGLIGLSTETMRTGGLRISNLQERGALWYPSFSGKDGSLLLPDDILDITETLEKHVRSSKDADLEADKELERYIAWGWPEG